MKTLLTGEEVICLRFPPGGVDDQAPEPVEPWWQRSPDSFYLLADRLISGAISFGHALGPADGRGGNHPVHTVIARTNVKTNSLADVLYFQLNGHVLSLRFQLQLLDELPEPRFEVTFVAADTATPLFVAQATLSPGGEYRMKANIPANFAKAWATLRVTDRMPFRFILKPESAG